MNPVPIVYFSDILCVWAYLSQPRPDEVERNFGDKVAIETRFCSVFGDTARKMETAWSTKGGYQGFNGHIIQAAAGFPEIQIHPDLWLSARPASSMSPHLFLKAAQLAETQGEFASGGAARLVRAMRAAFFMHAHDISEAGVQRQIAVGAGLPVGAIKAAIQDGRAFAALATDYHDAEAMGVKGSPSFVMNNGRQKLYGNVGYKIIEANIQELLREPNPDHASWC